MICLWTIFAVEMRESSLFSKYLWFMLNRNPTAFRRHVAINVPFFLFLCFSLPVPLCLFRDEFIYLLFYFWQISSAFLLLLSYLVGFLRNNFNFCFAHLFSVDFCRSKKHRTWCDGEIFYNRIITSCFWVLSWEVSQMFVIFAR